MSETDDLRARLHEQGVRLALLNGGMAPADVRRSAKLIDGVTFDVDGLPTNLDERLAAARETYGDTAVPVLPGAPGAGPGPDPHQGVRQDPPDGEAGTGWFTTKLGKAA